MSSGSQKTDFTEDELAIHGFEMAQILHLNGKKIYELAYALKKPAGFVGQTLLHMSKPIPLVYVEGFISFLGERIYRQSLAEVRRKNDEKPIYY